MMNRNQCTISWYVNDNKIPHKEAKVVDDMLPIFEEAIGDLTIMQGDLRDFFGMDLTITKEKSVEISMRK